MDIGVVGGCLAGGRGRGGGFVMLEGVLKNVGRSVVVGGGTGVKRGVEGMVDGVTEDSEEGEEDLDISCSTDSLSMSDESGSTLILIGPGLAGKVICGTVDGRGVRLKDWLLGLDQSGRPRLSLNKRFPWESTGQPEGSN